MNVVDLFTNLIFPAATAAYLLVVVTRKLEELRTGQTRLAAYMSLLLQKDGLPEAAAKLIEGKMP